MSEKNWKESQATLSVKQIIRDGFFSKKYTFLLMFSIKVEDDQTVEELGSFLTTETFIERIEFKLPPMPSIFGNTPEKEEEAKEEAPKKVRGSLMIAENVAVPKYIYDRHEESEKITIYYEATNPKNIKLDAF